MKLLRPFVYPFPIYRSRDALYKTIKHIQEPQNHIIRSIDPPQQMQKNVYPNQSINQSMLPIRSRRDTPLRALQILQQIFNRTNLDPPPLPKPQAPIAPHHAITPSNLRNALDGLALLN